MTPNSMNRKYLIFLITFHSSFTKSQKETCQDLSTDATAHSETKKNERAIGKQNTTVSMSDVK